MKQNIVLHIEDHPYLVIESNINLKPGNGELYAQVWKLPEDDSVMKSNELLKTYHGRYALTDAVLHLSEIFGEPVAHRITKKREGGEIFL